MGLQPPANLKGLCDFMVQARDGWGLAGLGSGIRVIGLGADRRGMDLNELA